MSERISDEQPKFPGTSSYSSRSKQRAEDVLHLLAGHVDLDGKVVLDLGCGPNPLLASFPEVCSRLVGLDKERRYITEVRRSFSTDLVLGDGTDLPFRGESFSFVLCNDVLEHVRDSKKLMKELSRVLARRGAAYIQCANKYQLIEPHFLLPFLSWIPRPFADFYVRMAGRGRNYEGYYPRTRKELLSSARGYRTLDITYERALMMVRTLNIQSKLLLGVVSTLRKILSDKIIAAIAQNFSIISIIVFKD